MLKTCASYGALRIFFNKKGVSMKKFLTLFSLIICAPLFAQTDDSNNAAFNPATANRGGGVGTFIGSITSPPTGVTGSTPVGLEHDGSGNLLVTEISNDQYFSQSTAGPLVTGPFNVAANNANPIGITTDGSTLYLTDTAASDVDLFDLAGNYLSSFDVSTETTFPEGITYVAPMNNLFVVDGAGGNKVSEYDLSGNLLNNYPINGSSQDGIAFDDQRCVFWIYDSGTDLVRSYDSSFTEIENFPGTGANGFTNGEGVGVIGNSLYVMAPGSSAIVEFDISLATPAANAATLCARGTGPAQIVPVNNFYVLALLSLLLMVFGAFTARRFQK